MRIDWWTLAIQAINFLILVWILRRFLYRPVRTVIEQRKALSEQAFGEAEKQKEEAAAARRRFEESQAGLAKERQDLLKKAHDELEAERHKALEEAKKKVNDLLEAAREATATERTAVLAEIRDEVAALAAALAFELLRKTGSGVSNGVFLEQIEHQLKGLAAEERERLQKDLDPESARLTVATATALIPEDRDHWIDRLGASFGRTDKTDFVTDPEILGGAELRFPHAVLKFTWAEHLRKATELLKRDDVAS